MRLRIVMLALSLTGLAIAAADFAQAADRRPMRMARSENRRFAVKIEPGRKTNQTEQVGVESKPTAAGEDVRAGHAEKVGSWSGELSGDRPRGATVDSQDNSKARGGVGESEAHESEFNAEERALAAEFEVDLDDERYDAGQADSTDTPRGAPASDGSGDDEEAAGGGDGAAEANSPENRTNRKASRSAQATLIEKRVGKRWTAQLVNEVAPGQAFVHDEGRYLVTLDEHGVGGARHALAIYGEDGSLRREFKLRELLTRADWKHVKAREKAVDWLRGARCRFVDSPDRFIVRLDWGREIVIDLERMDFDGQEPAPADDGHSEIPEEFAGLMDDGGIGELDEDFVDQALIDSLADALVQGAFQLELLSAKLDSATTSSEALAIKSQISAIEAQRLEAQDTLTRIFDESTAMEMTAHFRTKIGGIGRLVMRKDSPSAAAPTDEDTQEDAPVPETATEPARVPILSAIPVIGPLFRSVDEASGTAPADDLLQQSSSPDPTSTVVAPAPDPANPVNYIEWFKRQATTDGPSAAPIYAQARQQMVKWEGDDSLYRRAERGDADALASPEIQSFLSANQPSMLLTAQGNRAAYAGEYQYSPDDTHLYSILLPHLADTRQLAKTMEMQGRALAAVGRGDEAADYYLESMRLGGQSSRGNTLIENLVGVAVQNLSSSALLDIMAQDSATLDFVALAGRMGQESLTTRPLNEVFEFERAMGLDMVQRLFTYDADEQSYSASPQALRELSSFMSLTSGDAGHALETVNLAYQLHEQGFEGTVANLDDYYTLMAAAAAAPFQEGRVRMQAIEGRLSDPAFRMQNPLTAMVAPALSRATASAAANRAQQSATQLVVNLQAYRQQNGDYPDSLDAFADRSFITDPLTGEPFRYQRTADGFSLYSPGVDGVDEGGMPGANVHERDIVFWPRPTRP